MNVNRKRLEAYMTMQDEIAESILSWRNQEITEKELLEDVLRSVQTYVATQTVLKEGD